MNEADERFDVRGLFSDLLPPQPRPSRHLGVTAPSSLAGHLTPAWPDLDFTARASDVRAVTGRRASFRPALAFAPGLLRLPATAANRWASSTIPYAWNGGARLPGLGDRLLSLAVAAAERGKAVGAAMRSDQLGGHAGPSTAWVERRLAGACVLVADGIEDDFALLSHLLQSRRASELVVIVPTKGSRLARAARRAGTVLVLRQDVSDWDLVNAAAELHVPLHDEIAVLARIAGRAVIAYGATLPGCTDGTLAAAHLVLGTRYLDPTDVSPIRCEAFLDRLMEVHRLGRRVPKIGCFVGISFWKRRRMTEFAGGKASFARTAAAAVAKAAKAGGAIAVWPSRAPEGLDAKAAAAGIPLYRIEDGFIRSRGLGADFIPPASIIVDGRGIYYDASQPSDLAVMLQEQSFPPELLARARRLIDALVVRGITKYNLAGTTHGIEFPQGRRRILIPGQVADDLSIKTGAAGMLPGLPLVREVRRRNPEAFIVYKPHPDVEAGHRPGSVPDTELLQIADMVVRDVDMASLIDAVDEVHTITSLTGFEALLRERQVVTYGRPFYAGWGLTTDVNPPAGRTRRLTIEQLVAATLILYPHYIDPVTGLPCGPEQFIGRLDKAADWRTGLLVQLRRGQGALRRGVARRLSRTA
jgi:capsular polysaccharide export protein